MKKCFSNKFQNLILYRPYQFEVLCCFCNFKNLFREKSMTKHVFNAVKI